MEPERRVGVEGVAATYWIFDPAFFKTGDISCAFRPGFAPRFSL
jgi:hypothetical protein